MRRSGTPYKKLSERIDAKVATLQCPALERYNAKDAARDEERMTYLWRKRRSRRKLTPNEDADLAHINARYWAYRLGPEGRARERLRSLSERARIPRLAHGPSLSPWEKGELDFLRICYRPEVPEPSADHEAFLERESIFSACQVDADGFPMEYHRPVCPAPERIGAPTSEAAAAQPDDPGPQPEPPPNLEEDFEEFAALLYCRSRIVRQRRAADPRVDE